MSIKEDTNMGGGKMQISGDGGDNFHSSDYLAKCWRIQPRNIPSIIGKCWVDPSRAPSYHTRNTLLALAQRDGGWRCHYCGIPLLPLDAAAPYCDQYAAEIDSDTKNAPYVFYYKVFPEVDHKVARCKGGLDELSNLAMSCRQCNGEKAWLGYVEYLLKLYARVMGGGA